MPPEIWFAVLVLTHRLEVKKWWESDDQAAKAPEETGRRKYDGIHKNDWMNLGRSLQTYQVRHSETIEVPDMARGKRTLYILTAFRQMKLGNDAVLEWLD